MSLGDRIKRTARLGRALANKATGERLIGLLNSARRRIDRGLRPPLPPAALRFMNEDDALFLKVGDELVEDLQRNCRLGSSSSVLDVGCGYGRFAHALLRAPDFKGRYLGFDILPRHIAWCSDNLSYAYEPSVRFAHVDVRNDRYNPGGTIEPEAITFPCESRSIDVLLMASVFTHMYPAEVLRYLSEIRRVLKPGGAAMTSFFLLIDGSTGLEPKTAYPMVHALTPFCRYAKSEDPLFAIAYDWEWLKSRVQEIGLEVSGPPSLGSWCGGRSQTHRWQDFAILRR